MSKAEWVSTTSGRHLAGRRRYDTKPEVELRKAVHALGGRYRLHVRLAPGCRPDFVMPSRRLAVFVDGCFWHGCPRHGHRGDWAGPNADLWRDKMARNGERDRRADDIARSLGWSPVRVWECEIHDGPREVAERLLAMPLV